MKISKGTATLVVKPVRIKEDGSYLESSYIFTDETKEEEALEVAKKLSGLSQYTSWNFLIYGEISFGKVREDRNFKKQINNIARSKFNYNQDGRDTTFSRIQRKIKSSFSKGCKG